MIIIVAHDFLFFSFPIAGERIFTDDVSLRVFMEHLMKLAVQS